MIRRSLIAPSLVGLALAGLTSFAGLAGVARADVVSPPLDGTCPPGTLPGNSHGLEPSHCTILSCTTDADCSDGLVCGQQPLCSDGSWAIASCPDQTCEYLTCETLSVCLEASSGEGSDAGASAGDDAGNPSGRGCGCSTTDDGLLGISALVLLVSGLALRRRS